MLRIIRELARLLVAMLSPRAVLVAENLLLRQQLLVLRRTVARLRLKSFDRWFIAALASLSRRLREAILIVKPATVLRWHRSLWRWLWTRRSRRAPGRPAIDSELRALIRRMWRENPLWGVKRIAAECAALGWKVSPRTVAKYRPRGIERGRGQRWSTFVRNHLAQTWAIDLFTILSVRFHILYAVVVLSLERREIVHVAVTEHPTADWVAQHFVEAVADAETPPRFLIHDRDNIFGETFRRRVDHIGVRRLVIPPRSPRANTFCERVI